MLRHPIQVFGLLAMLAFTGCSNADANGRASETTNTIAPFRITRTGLPKNSTIEQLDTQCISEFGTSYTTSTSDEATGFTNVNMLQVFSYQFDRNSGLYSVNCSQGTFCTVLCIRKWFATSQFLILQLMFFEPRLAAWSKEAYAQKTQASSKHSRDTNLFRLRKFWLPAMFQKSCDVPTFPVLASNTMRKHCFWYENTASIDWP